MSETSEQSLIYNKLCNLTEEGGNDLLESIAPICVQMLKDKYYVFSSSGNTFGGDGGVDGLIEKIPEGKCRIQCSVNTSNPKEKIKKEINHKYSDNYEILCYVTNNVVHQRDKEKLKQYSKRKGLDLYILDRPELVNLIAESSECKKILGIPTEQDKLEIKHLLKHNQFSNEREIIDLYTPRSIVKIENTEDNNPISLYEFFKNPSDVSIIEAPAGYGKTSALKQTCNQILNEIPDYYSPPIYTSFSNKNDDGDNIYNSGDLERLIDNISVKTGDYYIENCVLIIDGVDELTKDNLRLLINDLSIWRNNKSLGRSIIFSGRTNEIDYKTIGLLGNIEKYTLSPLSDGEIVNIIEKNNSFDEYTNLAIKNYIFTKGLEVNLYLVFSLIEYVKKYKRIPSNNYEVISYIAVRNIKEVLKRSEIDTKAFGKTSYIALYNKQPYVSYDGIKTNINSFSHRYTLEYAAAYYLSLLNVKDFVSKTMKMRYVYSHMINVVSLALDILNQDNKLKYNKLIKIINRTPYNITVLMRIETSFSSNALKHCLVVSATESILIDHNPYRILDDYVRLFFDKSVIEENFLWLKKRIENSSNDEINELIHIVFLLSTRSSKKIPEQFRDFILQFTLNLLKKSNENKNAISTLYYVINILDFDKEQIRCCNNELYDFVSFFHKNEVFNNYCKICSKYSIEITLDSFIQLFNIFIDIKKENNIPMAGYVPLQIDNDYRIVTISHQFISDYYLLLNKVLKTNPEFIWSILKKMSDEDSENESCCLNDKELCCEIAKALESIYSHRKFSENELIILTKIMFEKYYNKRVFNSSMQEFATNLSIDILKRTVTNNSFKDGKYILAEIFRILLNKVFSDSHYYKQLISNDYCFKIEDIIPIERFYNVVSDDVISLLSDDCKRIIQDQKKQYLSESNSNEEYNKSIASSVHIIFNEELLKTTIKEICQKLPDTISPINCFKLSNDRVSRIDTSPLALFIIEEYVRSKHKVRRDDVIHFFNNINIDVRIKFLIIFIKKFNLSFTLLNSDELILVNDWIDKTLKRNPLSNFMANYKQVHSLLSIIMEDEDGRLLFNESLIKNKNLFKGYIVSGIIRSLETGILNEYDYSINYLEFYFDKQEILKCIIDNFDNIISNDYSRLCIWNYLSSIDFNMIDVDGYLKRVKALVIQFVKSNFSKKINCFYGLIKFCEKASITSEIFDSELFDDGLCFSENDGEYEDTVANYFLKAREKRTPNENCFLNNYIYHRFKKLGNKQVNEKKYLAEVLVVHGKNLTDVGFWYLDYLYNSESTISERLFGFASNEVFCFGSIKVLHKLEKIWLKYYNQEGLKADLIRNSVIKSYQMIVKDNNTILGFFLVINSIRRMFKKTNSLSMKYAELSCISEFASS